MRKRPGRGRSLTTIMTDDADKPRPLRRDHPRIKRFPIAEKFPGAVRPGFAQNEEDPTEGKDDAPKPGHAHYEGMQDSDAAEVWKAETLCLRCYHAPVCRHFQGADEALVVVSRCLAFIPAPG